MFYDFKVFLLLTMYQYTEGRKKTVLKLRDTKKNSGIIIFLHVCVTSCAYEIKLISLPKYPNATCLLKMFYQHWFLLTETNETKFFVRSASHLSCFFFKRFSNCQLVPKLFCGGDAYKSQ